MYSWHCITCWREKSSSSLTERTKSASARRCSLKAATPEALKENKKKRKWGKKGKKQMSWIIVTLLTTECAGLWRSHLSEQECVEHLAAYFTSVTTCLCVCYWSLSLFECKKKKNRNWPFHVYHLICLCKTRCPLVAWQMWTRCVNKVRAYVWGEESAARFDGLMPETHRQTWLAFHPLNHFITPQRKRKKKRDERPLIC